MAIKPRRYLLLKNAYNIGLMQEFDEPSHCAIGVATWKNSSCFVLNGPPLQIKHNNTLHKLMIIASRLIQLCGQKLTKFHATK